MRRRRRRRSLDFLIKVGGNLRCVREEADKVGCEASLKIDSSPFPEERGLTGIGHQSLLLLLLLLLIRMSRDLQFGCVSVCMLFFFQPR